MDNTDKSDSPMPHWVRDVASAMVMLTRVPIPPQWCHTSPEDWRTASWAYPIVGVLVGGVLGGAITGALGLGLSPLISVLVAMGLTFLITGALHEDGLADTADGFGGGHETARKLAIMKDSQIGTYGVLALISAMGLTAAALHALAAHPAIVLICIWCASLSRAAMLAPVAILSSARSGGLADSMVEVKGAQIVKADSIVLIVGVSAALEIGLWPVLLSGAVALITTAALMALMQKHIHGYTGDTLGATQVCTHTATLICLSALLPT